MEIKCKKKCETKVIIMRWNKCKLWQKSPNLDKSYNYDNKKWRQCYNSIKNDYFVFIFVAKISCHYKFWIWKEKSVNRKSL